MSILSALKQQHSSIDSLAALPQAMIMQMAQRKEISEAMVAPILARKAELADAFARQNMLANAGKAQPTVMEQLLTKNAQMEQPVHNQAPMQQPMPQEAAPAINPQQMGQAPENTGVAQIPIPERQYAGGGIVAFGSGGMPDDDEEDDREESNFLAMMDAIPAGIKGIPAKLSELASHLPKSYEATKAGIASAASKMSGHKYEDAVIAEAKRQGVDPKLALHVLYKETGNLKNPESARSHAGAIGPMQLMPKTAKSLGVDPTDPMQNIHGGVKYLAQLGKMFDNDPRLTAAAYNAGPGNVRKHGGVPNFKETQNYVVGLAQGGEVQHYASGGATQADLDAALAAFNQNMPEDYEDYAGGPMSQSDYYRQRNLGLNAIRGNIVPPKPAMTEEQKRAYKTTYGKVPSVSTSTTSNAANKASQADVRKSDQQIAENVAKSSPDVVTDNNLTVRPIAQTMASAPAEKSGLENFMAQMLQQKSDLQKQRQEDRNMALMAAGLGMLGGSSQHAWENIGKGGLAGVQHLAEANKQRAAEQAAINKNLLYAHHYQGVEEAAKANAANTVGLRQNELLERQRANNLSAIKSMKDDARAIAIAGLKQQGMIGMDMDNPDTAMKIEQATRAILANEPAYADLYRSTFGVNYNTGTQNSFAGFSAKERKK